MASTLVSSASTAHGLENRLLKPLFHQVRKPFGTVNSLEALNRLHVPPANKLRAKLLTNDIPRECTVQASSRSSLSLTSPAKRRYVAADLLDKENLPLNKPVDEYMTPVKRLRGSRGLTRSSQLSVAGSIRNEMKQTEHRQNLYDLDVLTGLHVRPVNVVGKQRGKVIRNTPQVRSSSRRKQLSIVKENNVTRHPGDLTALKLKRLVGTSQNQHAIDCESSGLRIQRKRSLINVTRGIDRSSMPRDWFFEIHRDTEVEEATNIMEHSASMLNLDSSVWLRPWKSEREKHGKENVAPPDYDKISVSGRGRECKGLMKLNQRLMGHIPCIVDGFTMRATATKSENKLSEMIIVKDDTVIEVDNMCDVTRHEAKCEMKTMDDCLRDNIWVKDINCMSEHIPMVLTGRRVPLAEIAISLLAGVGDGPVELVTLCDEPDLLDSPMRVVSKESVVQGTQSIDCPPV